MKKVLAGCLAVVLIAGVALAVALYVGYRAMRPMIDHAAAVLAQAEETASQSARIENTAPYHAPEDGVLTEAQVRRFLAVHERTRQALGPAWAQLRSQAEALERQATRDARALSLAEVASMLSALGSIVVDARRAHVDALNAERFSAGEYAWVRLRAYEAAGLEAVEGIDWSALQDAIRTGTEQVGLPAPAVRLPEVPEQNRNLVKPHIEALKAWLPLTILGL